MKDVWLYTIRSGYTVKPCSLYDRFIIFSLTISGIVWSDQVPYT